MSYKIGTAGRDFGMVNCGATFPTANVSVGIELKIIKATD